jgi:dihydroxyacetone kinase
VLEGPKGENVDDGMLVALVGKLYPNMFMLMEPALRGMNAFDAPVNGVDPDDGPKAAVADGDEEKKRGGGDVRKLLLKGAMGVRVGDVMVVSRRKMLAVRDCCSSVSLG